MAMSRCVVLSKVQVHACMKLLHATAMLCMPFILQMRRLVDLGVYNDLAHGHWSVIGSQGGKEGEGAIPSIMLYSGTCITYPRLHIVLAYHTLHCASLHTIMQTMPPAAPMFLQSNQKQAA